MNITPELTIEREAEERGGWTPGEVSTGTTIVAARYDGGVVLGADSRVTTGTYVSNRASDKITPLCDNVFLCRSGSAADTQLVSDYVRHYLEQHAVELEDGRPAVRTAANLVMQLNYNNKDHLMAGMICAGWDKYEGGSVWALPIGGSLLAVPYTVGGSGSTYIYGFCDAAFKEGMTREECEEFVTKAVAHAMSRDGSSGGLIRLVTVNSDGATRRMVQGPNIPLFFEELAN
mmetsp:Transcript_6712/g.24856  ORF Transcript_6712/g.24856 Transcript_6712/m.24856 type:complete len:232 (-) Transcript_6712:87-782(-)